MSQQVIGKTLLKRYRVEEFITSGGTKAVYRVWDIERNVPLAMKMLHTELEDNPSLLRSFQRDANAIKKLTHPHIVRFYGLVRSEDSFFILEEFVDGPSLKEILKEHKKFPLQEALIYFKALCAALGFAHAKGIVHCDVKPGNILVDQGGKILLTDFGIARHVGSDSTSTFAGAGTPAYMAPEQVRGEAVTAETDVYALGILFYELLTGSRPFQGTEAELQTSGSTLNERIRYAQLKIRPPDPRTINPKINREVASEVLKALEKDPDKRFHTTQEFLSAVCLSAGISEESIPDRVVLSKRTSPQQTTPTTFLPSSPGKTNELLVSTSLFLKQAWLFIWPQRAPYFALGAVTLGLVSFLIFTSFQPRPTGSVSLITSSTASIATATRTATKTPPPAATRTAALKPTVTPTTVPPPPLDWYLNAIDTNQQVGLFSSQIIDSTGTRYVTYLDDKEPNNDPKLASSTGGKWALTTVIKQAKRDGWYPSIALDSMGILHFSHFAYDDKQVRYGSRTGSGFWNFPDSDIVARNVKAIDVSLVIDDNDIPHVVYFDNTTKSVRYAKKGSRGWTQTAIAAANPEAIYFPVGIDDKNQLHVVFLADTGGLWHSVLSGGSWSTPQPIDQSDGAGYFPSIAFDVKGNPYVSYYDRSNGDLKYAYKENKDWKSITVDHQGDVGQYTSIGVDKKGNIHISYYDVDHHSLKYALSHDNPEDPNNWYQYQVDDQGDVGTWSSLILDQDGNPGISYYDATSEILLFAYANVNDLSAIP